MARTKKKTSAKDPNNSPDSDHDNQKKPRTVWTSDDIEKLLQKLVKRHSRIGQGGNSKIAVFNEVAAMLNLLKFGAHKTGKGCKDKYGTPKRDWEEVIKINSKSGWPSWDQHLGANITTERENNWNEYVKSNPRAAQFRNKGYEHQEHFDVLMPLSTTLPKELNVCCISRGKKTEGPESDESDSDDNNEEGAETQAGDAASLENGSGAAVRRHSPDWNMAVMDQDLEDATNHGGGHASQLLLVAEDILAGLTGDSLVRNVLPPKPTHC
ncbi:hypothetical protein V5O48_011104 [Marasmius crinis-equi]|uniref:Myb/SANT-like domain-containing protein n=1 Tax=Marasmius crinis-equi TaxID=585013 RepID=A0ABR3F6V4_9AGAR